MGKHKKHKNNSKQQKMKTYNSKTYMGNFIAYLLAQMFCRIVSSESIFSGLNFAKLPEQDFKFLNESESIPQIRSFIQDVTTKSIFDLVREDSMIIEEPIQDSEPSRIFDQETEEFRSEDETFVSQYVLIKGSVGFFGLIAGGLLIKTLLGESDDTDEEVLVEESKKVLADCLFYI